jgi:molybdopterin converting factor small subunit
VSEVAEVTVEFFGIPRRRAGRAELAVRAATVTEALAAVERACPDLTGLVHVGGALSRHYLLSLGGKEFVSDLRQPLRTGDRLLLLSADAGG